MQRILKVLYGFLLAVSLVNAPFASALQCNGKTWTPNDRYRTERDVVFDKKTGLAWKRCAEGMQWNGKVCLGEAHLYSWREVNEQIFTDTTAVWHLPNILDLASLRSGGTDADVFSGRPADAGCWSPAINVSVFPGKQFAMYWSVSTDGGYSRMPFGVNFTQGVVGFLYPDDRNAVRLVRTVSQKDGDMLSGKNCALRVLPDGAADAILDGERVKVFPAGEAINTHYDGCQTVWTSNRGRANPEFRFIFSGGRPVAFWERSQGVVSVTLCFQTAQSPPEGEMCAVVKMLPLKTVECRKDQPVPGDSVSEDGNCSADE